MRDPLCSFSWFLFGWREEESEEGWVRQIGGENVCVLWAEGKIVI
jgi:hypothetical protein